MLLRRFIVCGRSVNTENRDVGRAIRSVPLLIAFGDRLL